MGFQVVFYETGHAAQPYTRSRNAHFYNAFANRFRLTDCNAGGMGILRPKYDKLSGTYRDAIHRTAIGIEIPFGNGIKLLHFLYGADADDLRAAEDILDINILPV